MPHNYDMSQGSPEADPTRQAAIASLHDAIRTQTAELPPGSTVLVADVADPQLVNVITTLETPVSDPYERTHLPMIAVGSQTPLDGRPVVNWDLFFDGRTYDFIGEERRLPNIPENMSADEMHNLLEATADETEESYALRDAMRETEDGATLLGMEASMNDRSSTDVIRDLARSIADGEIVPGFAPTE